MKQALAWCKHLQRHTKDKRYNLFLYARLYWAWCISEFFNITHLIKIDYAQSKSREEEYSN